MKICSSQFFVDFENHILSDFRDFTRKIYLCLCLCALVNLGVCVYDGVQKTGTAREMTKHAAERGSDNETEEQGKTQPEKEKVTKAVRK